MTLFIHFYLILVMAVFDPQTRPFNQKAIRVFYDGSCPLCRREIALYRGLRSTVPVEWCDVSDCESGNQLPLQTSRCDLMQRFHLQTECGELKSGAAAFIHLWARLPRWRILAGLAKIPGMTALMEAAYNGFLRIRPFLQRLMKG